MYTLTSTGRSTVNHARSYTMKKCSVTARGTFMQYSKYSDTAEGLLDIVKEQGIRLCKTCRKHLEEIANGTPATPVLTANSDSAGREMPSLEEIAEQEPLIYLPLPLPVIPVFVCLISADMARTWCDQATASVRSTIDMHDATCPSCVGLVQAELSGSPVPTAAQREEAAQEFARTALERVKEGTPVSTREAWLVKAVEILTVIFEETGYTVPPVRISVGWPGGKGPKAMLKTIGQCWYKENAADGIAQIFISPALVDPAVILATIAHEMVHAVVGSGHGHRGPFRTCALKIGLTGKMTETNAGDELKAKFPAMLEELGKYDHAKLNASTKTKPGNQNRHLKIECQHCEFTARTTRKQMDTYDMPQHCGEEMREA